MEKRTPTYDLEGIKGAARDGSLNVTFSANQTVFRMGAKVEDLFQLIQALSIREHFYKSMTSYADHRIWQDVYHVEWCEVMMYLKFTIDDNGYLVVSFKAK